MVSDDWVCPFSSIFLTFILKLSPTLTIYLSKYHMTPLLNAVTCFLQVGSVDGGSRKVFVIDEIGKMELFSQSFIRSVRQTLDSSSCTILGTIPIPKGKPLGLVEEVRSRRDVKVFSVSVNTSTL